MFTQDRVLSFLLAYRWAALLPAIWLILRAGPDAGGEGTGTPLLLGIVSFLNLLLTLVNRPLNQWVLRIPLLLGMDLLLSSAILSLSGGLRSPYYLYVLSPLLAAAFFFRMRGALGAAAFFTPLYLGASLIGTPTSSWASLDSPTLLTQLAGIWLIPILFAYPSTLLKAITQAREQLTGAQKELAEKHENLTMAHRQLEIIHDLTVLLQSAPDLVSVEQRVLGAVTTDLGFSKALIGIVDPAHEQLGEWQLYPPDPAFPAIGPTPLKPENGEGIRALFERRVFQSEGQVLVNDPSLISWLGSAAWLVLPMHLREHPVGLLLVEMEGGQELTDERLGTITTVANQAALALGTTILCIDRARRLAVEQERNRIARDIHDTVAQSLFGIVYSLDACVNMLPAQADAVRDELIELRALASGAHDEVRRSIFDMWPSALTLNLFTADLTSYVNQCCRPRRFTVDFRVTGNFDELSPGLRRTIYRMAQEGLANSARHSGGDSAQFCMHIAKEMVYINIEDLGRGFEVETALRRSHDREHFGLQGMRERVRGMGGECEIFSQPGAGTSIVISLPVKGSRGYTIA